MDQHDWVIRISNLGVTNYVASEEPRWDLTPDISKAKGYETKRAARKAAQAFSCGPLSDAPFVQAVQRERS